jgi:hypothetical protein
MKKTIPLLAAGLLLGSAARVSAQTSDWVGQGFRQAWGSLNDVIKTDSLFVAVGDSVLTSRDGVAWTARSAGVKDSQQSEWQIQSVARFSGRNQLDPAVFRNDVRSGFRGMERDEARGSGRLRHDPHLDGRHGLGPFGQVFGSVAEGRAQIRGLEWLPVRGSGAQDPHLPGRGRLDLPGFLGIGIP